MHKSYYDTEYVPSNREKVLTPKGNKSSWCVCDINKVADGEKCKVCYRRNGKKRFKI